MPKPTPTQAAAQETGAPFAGRLVRRLIGLARKRGALGSALRADLPFTMISNAEILFLDLLLRASPGPLRIAELGCYVGGTTCLFADAAPKGSTIEVHDLFEHNPASRLRLKDDPLFNPKDFLAIWRRNTAAHAGAIDLLQGDLRETAGRSGPLDLVYVDIVKHRSLVNLLAGFHDRLETGGLLLHQDYFHWQSPWLVYQMEHLVEEGTFRLLGDVGKNMTVYRKMRACGPRLDYLDGLSRETKLELFGKAIARHDHAKAGLLAVSRLGLVLQIGGAEPERLAAEIAEAHAGNPRVMRYLKACLGAAGREFVW